MDSRRPGYAYRAGWLLCGALTFLLPAAPAWSTPFAWVSTQRSFVSVIDIDAGTEVASLDTGGGSSYWIAASRQGNVVATSLHDTAGVATFDATTRSLIGTVGGVGSEPEAVAVSSDGSTVYVADESGDTLYIVDVGSLGVVHSVDISDGCSEPENMVISPDDSELFITCAGSSVIRVATTAPFSMGLIDSGLSDPHGIALDPTGEFLYYTDGSDALEWNTMTQGLTGTTFTGCDMYNGAVSPDGTLLYCVEEGSQLTIYQTATGAMLGGPVDLGSFSATGVAVRPDGTRAYVAVDGGGGRLIGSLVEVDPTTQSVTDVFGVTGIGATSPRPRGVVIVGEEGEPAEATTTTTTTTSTTTTTLPGCPQGTSFESLNCRLSFLIDQVEAESQLGQKFKKALRKRARKAKQLKEKAEARCLKGKRRSARRLLRGSARRVIGFRHILRSLRGRKNIPADVRERLLAAADPLRKDLGSKRKTVRCPDDAL